MFKSIKIHRHSLRHSLGHSLRHLFKLAALGFGGVLALVLGALLVGLPAMVGAQGSEPPEQTSGQGTGGGIGVQAVVGTAFTYQGRLLKEGTAVDGVSCNFTFDLYDTADVGTGNKLNTVSPSAPVSDGYFAVELNFGQAFTGEARWLEVTVQCPGDGSPVLLDSARVALNAVPYAHGLRPGAEVESSGKALSLSTSATGGSALDVHASATGGNAAAVYARSDSPGGAGLSGYNASTGYGVYGSSSGYGVYGSSPGGHGVHGASTSGYGVYGYSSSDYAVYADGDAYVEGDLILSPRTGYVSVSAAAFVPEDGSTTYLNHGEILSWGGIGSGRFYAPVQLPHGATVTAMQFRWWDNSETETVTCTLYVSGLGTYAPSDPAAEMVEVASTGAGGNGSETSGFVDPSYATVDNSLYAYYLRWHMDGDARGRGVIIQYQFTKPH